MDARSHFCKGGGASLKRPYNERKAPHVEQNVKRVPYKEKKGPDIQNIFPEGGGGGKRLLRVPM